MRKPPLARAPPAAADAHDRVLAAFRDLMLEAGYDSPVVAEARRMRRLLMSDTEIPPALRSPDAARTRTLVELFALGREVPRERAEDALAPLRIEALESLGLVQTAGDRVATPYQAEAHDGLLLFGDGGAVARDLVRGLFGPSVLAARLTPRRPVRSMLDLGTGSGIQALLAARHAEQVVAVDVNERALDFGRLNARINGVDNVEWRQGSWFAPVGDARFDLIVCNPPYVISPDSEFTFRDSGLGPGALIEELCAAIPGHLAEDGLGLILCMWPHANDGDWDVAPIRWAAQSGCGAIVVCFETLDPVEHAVTWNSPFTRRMEVAEFSETVQRWYRFYAAHEIGALSFGAVVFSRGATEKPWSLVRRAGSQPGPGAAKQVERIIAGHELLDRSPDLRLCQFAVPDGFSVGQRFVRRDGGWIQKLAVARTADELGVSADIDVDALATVFRCSGSVPLGELMPSRSDDSVVISSFEQLLRCGLLDIV